MFLFEGIVFVNVLFKSVIMNILMLLIVFLFYKVMDCFIDKKYEVGKGIKVKFKDVVNIVDWNVYFGFSVLKIILFFWILCYIIVFLFFVEYRVIVFVFVFIVLGLILVLVNKFKVVV